MHVEITDMKNFVDEGSFGYRCACPGELFDSSSLMSLYSDLSATPSTHIPSALRQSQQVKIPDVLAQRVDWIR